MHFHRIVPSSFVAVVVAAAMTACAPAQAAWTGVGAVTQVTKQAQGATLATTSGAVVTVTFLGDDTVRVRMTPPGQPVDTHSYAVEPTTRAPGADVTTDDRADSLTLRAKNGLRIDVRKSPALGISVFDADNRLVVADDPARPLAFDPDSGAVEASKRRTGTELYYGFGETPLPLSRQNQQLVFWNTDAGFYPPGSGPIYQTTPFFIASDAQRSYGLFFDNTWRSRFDMGASDTARYTFGANGGALDYYIFGGGRERTPANVLREYAELTGTGRLPPLWALGYQQSRYSYTPQAKVEAIAHTFREKQIPADVIYLDIDYMDGYRVFTWSPTNFGDAKGMLARLHEQGFHAVTIIDPGVKVDDAYAVYRSGRAQDVFVKDAKGAELQARVWPGVCAFPDFTAAKTRAWWGGLYAKPLSEGVDGFWNDMNEPATFPVEGSLAPVTMWDESKTFALDVRHDGDGQPGDHARYHNVYGMQMARATFEGLTKLRPDQRPLVLTRAGYAGVQRYAAVWTGDNIANWEHLALTVPMLTNLSVSGIPFVGADVGGFNGTPSAELYTRWLQAAVLTPFLRTHSAIDTAEREPWSWGGDYERINKATIELRYVLLPYLYTQFALNEHDGGQPPLRPLWFGYPHDAQAALIDDEYLVGADLLVAPVLQEGSHKRRVYFPKGSQWVDWWNGSQHDGGTSEFVEAPLDHLPLYVRAGAAVPTEPVIQSTREARNVPLTLVVARGGDAAVASTVYQDAGDGYAYRQGASRTIRVDSDAHGVTLVVPPNKGWQRLAAVEFTGVAKAPASVQVDGRRVDAGFDAATHRLRVALPNENIKRVTLVE